MRYRLSREVVRCCRPSTVPRDRDRRSLISQVDKPSAVTAATVDGVERVRRGRVLLPIGIAVMALVGGGYYFADTVFAPADNGDNGVPPGAGVPLRGPANPVYAVTSVYAAIAAGDPGKVCPDLFTDQGRAQFAHDIGAGAATCDDAVRAAATKVTNGDAYAGLSVPLSAVHLVGASSATVYSCAVDVSGGPKLGAFVLANTTNGWIIVGHQPDPDPCPQPVGG